MSPGRCRAVRPAGLQNPIARLGQDRFGEDVLVAQDAGLAIGALGAVVFVADVDAGYVRPIPMSF